jgi:protein TonB
MFNYLGGASTSQHATRWTTAVSALAHIAVVLILVIPALYATDALPEPKETIAFFVSTPTAPPPPAPPPPPAETPKPAQKRVPQAAARPAPVARVVAPAPVEAPSTIRPETGLEGIASRAEVEAGFEGGVESGVPGGVIGGVEVTAPSPPPPPPAAPTTPVRVGGSITAPRLLQRVPPDYPLVAQHAQIEGVVILEATVGPDGRVDDVKVLRSHSILDAAAVEAVEQWVYEPLMLNGQAYPFVLTVTVSFSLAR